MLPRPWIVLNCCSSCCSLDRARVGSTEFGCCAAAGCDANSKREQRQGADDVAKFGDERRHANSSRSVLVAGLSLAAIVRLRLMSVIVSR